MYLCTTYKFNKGPEWPNKRTFAKNEKTLRVEQLTILTSDWLYLRSLKFSWDPAHVNPGSAPGGYHHFRANKQGKSKQNWQSK